MIRLRHVEFEVKKIIFWMNFDLKVLSSSHRYLYITHMYWMRRDYHIDFASKMCARLLGGVSGEERRALHGGVVEQRPVQSASRRFL